MSNTRKAEPGAGFRQERFASSPEFERGLMANLVARRCELLESPEDRELIWFLQLLSHREGGLGKVAQDLLTKFPERNATASMRSFGTKPGQIYSASQVKAVRSEIPLGEEEFPLCGELTGHEAMGLPDVPDAEEDSVGHRKAVKRHEAAHSVARSRPASYPAVAFETACREAAKDLPERLAELCLNPAMHFSKAGPWYFPDLVITLREFDKAWVDSRRAGMVFTELGKQVCETLEYSLQERCLTLVDGLARTGKTHAARAWCELHPGQVRYIQVPSTNDEIGFFRAIAKSIGVSINLNSKAQELRARIEEAIQDSRLMLVFDEAHYLWPNSSYRQALPGRINWIMTALVNFGVPVSLVTTPQFLRTQKMVEKRSCWTSEQFIGRIGHYQKLPESLSKSDLLAVAKAILPEGCEDSLEVLVTYAQASAKYLAAIDATVHRARFLAKRDGRSEAKLRDVKLAIKQNVIPSDSALAEALAPERRAPRAAPRRQPTAASLPRIESPQPQFSRRSQVDLVPVNANQD